MATLCRKPTISAAIDFASAVVVDEALLLDVLVNLLTLCGAKRHLREVARLTFRGCFGFDSLIYLANSNRTRASRFSLKLKNSDLPVFLSKRGEVRYAINSVETAGSRLSVRTVLSFS